MYVPETAANVAEYPNPITADELKLYSVMHVASSFALVRDSLTQYYIEDEQFLEAVAVFQFLPVHLQYDLFTLGEEYKKLTIRRKRDHPLIFDSEN